MQCKYCGKENNEQYCSKDCLENHESFSVIERLTDELDIVFKFTEYPWKVYLTGHSYDIVKNRPGTKWCVESRVYKPAQLVIERDGHEYLLLWDNKNIPIYIAGRIASTDAVTDKLELDDFNRPNIKQEYQDEWNNYVDEEHLAFNWQNQQIDTELDV